MRSALAALLACVAAGGCCSQPPNGGHPIAGVYGWREVTTTARSNYQVDTPQPLRFHARGDVQPNGYYADYHVLILPLPGGARARAMLHNSEPDCVLEEGEAYAIGRWPVVSTGRVSGVAEGTAIMAAIITVQGKEVHRLYLIDAHGGKGARWKIPTSGKERRLTKPSYVDVELNAQGQADFGPTVERKNWSADDLARVDAAVQAADERWVSFPWVQPP